MSRGGMRRAGGEAVVLEAKHACVMFVHCSVSKILSPGRPPPSSPGQRDRPQSTTASKGRRWSTIADHGRPSSTVVHHVKPCSGRVDNCRPQSICLDLCQRLNIRHFFLFPELWGAAILICTCLYVCVLCARVSCDVCWSTS